MPQPPSSRPPRPFRQAWLHGLATYVPSMLIVGLLRRWYDHAPWPDALRWGLGLGFAMSFSEPVKESLRRRGMGYLAAACIGGLVAVALAVGLWVAINVVLRG